MEANGDNDEEERENKVKKKKFRAFEARLEWKPPYLNSRVEPVRWSGVGVSYLDVTWTPWGYTCTLPIGANKVTNGTKWMDTWSWFEDVSAALDFYSVRSFLVTTIFFY